MNQLLGLQGVKQPDMMSSLIGCKTMNIYSPDIGGTSYVSFASPRGLTGALDRPQHSLRNCILSAFTCKRWTQKLNIRIDLLRFQIYTLRLVDRLHSYMELPSHHRLQ